MVRTRIRHIVDGVAEGQKYHLKLVFSDNSTYHSTHLGDPDVTIIFRNRAAEWRMALGGRRVLDELEDDPLPRIC